MSGRNARRRPQARCSSTDPARSGPEGRTLPSVRGGRLSTRRPDDADVIRARLRALLEDRERDSGWVPDDPLEDDDEPPPGGWPPSQADVPEPPENLGRHRAPARTVRWSPGWRGARSLWLAALGAA